MKIIIQTCKVLTVKKCFRIVSGIQTVFTVSRISIVDIIFTV